MNKHKFKLNKTDGQFKYNCYDGHACFGFTRAVVPNLFDTVEQFSVCVGCLCVLAGEVHKSMHAGGCMCASMCLWACMHPCMGRRAPVNG